MSNAVYGNNEYTTLEQRKKQLQSLSKPYVTPDVVYEAPATSGSSVDNSYNNAINELKSLYASELARQREEAAQRQARLEAQQLQLKNQRDEAINNAYTSGKESLNTAKDNSLATSYVAYMKGLKAMPQVAAAGGNGGYAQSLAAKQQLNYENNRNNIEQSYLENLRQLEADKNNALTSSAESYTQGLMGLQSDAQDYLASLNAMQNDANGYASQMESLIKGLKTAATNNKDAETAGYKIGNKTYTRDEYINHLIGLGMSKEEAYNYMKNNKLL